MLQRLSSRLVQFKSKVFGAEERLLYDKMNDTVSVKDFGAKGDGVTDDTEAIQKALDAAHASSMKLRIPAGVYLVSATLIVKLGTHYSEYGLSIEGEGRGASVIQFQFADTNTPSSGIQLVTESGNAGYNFNLTGLTLKGVNANAVSSLIYCNIDSSGITLSDLYLQNCITAFHTTRDCWISEFHNLNISCRDYGIRMDASGTTNRFDGCFVYGASISAYKLRGGYSSIGSLAADNCKGTIYDLRFFEGSAQCLGSEQPNVGTYPEYIVNCDGGTISIDYILGFKSAPVNGSAWYAINVGSGTVSVKNLIISSNTGSDTNLSVSGGLVRGLTGAVDVQNIVAAHNIYATKPLPLTFSTPLIRNSPWKVKAKTSTEVAVFQGSKPYIGFGVTTDAPQDLDGLLSKRNLQAIYMDASGNPKGSGLGSNMQENRDQYKAAPAQGSWFMENDPLATGRMGYTCSKSGSDINSSTFLGIPVITTQKPTKDLIVGQSFFSVGHKKPVWWDGSNWVDATGTIVS